MILGNVIALGAIIDYIVSYFRIVLKYDVNEDNFNYMLPVTLALKTIFFMVGN